jgi:hypothetical protein
MYLLYSAAVTLTPFNRSRERRKGRRVIGVRRGVDHIMGGVHTVYVDG